MTTYRVTASALELRSGPGTDHSIITQLPRGAEVTGLGAADTAGWMQVATQTGAHTGWVAAHYLAPQESVPMGGDAHPPATAPAVAPGPGPSTAARPLASGPGQVANTLVFDCSHFNGQVDFAAAYQAGQRGVIHKASQGLKYVDAMFQANRAKARAAGLLFGAYHFGTGDDPLTQAEHFLATVGADGQTLLALDWEPNPQGAAMTLAQARAFVTQVQQKTGKWPGLYSGSTAREALGSAHDPVLGNCWFWLAQYSAEPVVPPAWGGWTLWQCTDGQHGPGPYEVPGVGRCDRNRFAGDAGALAAFWAANC